MSSLAPLGKVEAEGWEEDGEEENTREVYTANRLSTYQTTDFPPKPVSIIEVSEADEKYKISLLCRTW